MQTKKVTRPSSTYVEEEMIAVPSREELLDMTDELLEAIDEALGDEINFALEFWCNWIQKGGQ
jgi:hypothetical protein